MVTIVRGLTGSLETTEEAEVAMGTGVTMETEVVMEVAVTMETGVTTGEVLTGGWETENHVGVAEEVYNYNPTIYQFVRFIELLNYNFLDRTS